MRIFLTLAMIVALFVSVTPVVADQAEDEAAIRKMVEQERAAYNKHDAKAMASSMVENIEGWTGERKGRKQLSEYWARDKVQSKPLDEIGIIFVTPDVAILKTRSEYSGMVDEDGKSLPPEKSLASWVLVKKNGKWLLAAFFNRPIEE